ncbi:hypothetical protein OH491_15365 [Termitidicoccus mucosus]|uniref:hypothetical protein n=1 Tax=Termitidicoccus mucosus TaxID=1184151 RepID=UPI003182F7EA
MIAAAPAMMMPETMPILPSASPFLRRSARPYIDDAPNEADREEQAESVLETGLNLRGDLSQNERTPNEEPSVIAAEAVVAAHSGKIKSKVRNATKAPREEGIFFMAGVCFSGPRHAESGQNVPPLCPVFPGLAWTSGPFLRTIRPFGKKSRGEHRQKRRKQRSI